MHKVVVVLVTNPEGLEAELDPFYMNSEDERYCETIEIEEGLRDLRDSLEYLEHNKIVPNISQHIDMIANGASDKEVYEAIFVNNPDEELIKHLAPYFLNDKGELTYNHYYNPKGEYDWYSIGGRWKNKFLYDKTNNKFIDVVKLKDLELDLPTFHKRVKEKFEHDKRCRDEARRILGKDLMDDLFDMNSDRTISNTISNEEGFYAILGKVHEDKLREGLSHIEKAFCYDDFMEFIPSLRLREVCSILRLSDEYFENSGNELQVPIPYQVLKDGVFHDTSIDKLDDNYNIVQLPYSEKVKRYNEYVKLLTEGVDPETTVVVVDMHY